MGGEDGFDTGFYADPEVERALDSHLEILYREVREDKRMPASMRNARLSMLHKGKGRSPMLPKNYRPVAVTNTAYRILMKAVQLKLAPATTAVVGKTQIAYLTDGRRMWDNTLLLAEVARLLEAEGEGGAVDEPEHRKELGLGAQRPVAAVGRTLKATPQVTRWRAASGERTGTTCTPARSRQPACVGR